MLAIINPPFYVFILPKFFSKITHHPQKSIVFTFSQLMVFEAVLLVVLVVSQAVLE
jgi:hypothetical protein